MKKRISKSSKNTSVEVISGIRGSKFSFLKYFHIFWSISFLLGFFFATSLCVLGGGIISIFVGMSQNSITNLFKEKNQLILSSVQRYANTWLGQGEKIIPVLENYLRRQEEVETFDNLFAYNHTNGKKTIFDFHQVLIRLIRSHVSISYVGYGNPEGTFCCVSPTALLLRNQTNMYPNKTYANKHYTENYEYGEYVLNQRAKNYDFRANPTIIWYSNAMEGGPGYVWSNFMISLGSLTSSLSKQYFDSNGIRRGVLTVWFNMDLYKDFLRGFSGVSEKGTLFVIDKGDGLLVASSTESDIFWVDDEDVKHRVQAVESSDSVIKSTSIMLKKKYGSMAEVPTIETPVYHDKRFVTVINVNVTGNSFMIVFVQDYLVVFGETWLASILSVVFSFVLILVLLVFLVAILLSVVSPLTRLTKNT